MSLLPPIYAIVGADGRQRAFDHKKSLIMKWDFNESRETSSSSVKKLKDEHAQIFKSRLALLAVSGVHSEIYNLINDNVPFFTKMNPDLAASAFVVLRNIRSSEQSDSFAEILNGENGDKVSDNINRIFENHWDKYLSANMKVSAKKNLTSKRSEMVKADLLRYIAIMLKYVGI